jgi:hypothetical protein
MDRAQHFHGRIAQTSPKRKNTDHDRKDTWRFRRYSDGFAMDF